MIEHEQTYGRRQITLLTIAVDLANQFGKRLVTLARNFLHGIPEWFFQADAGLMTANHDRAFYDWRLHFARPSLVKI
jgi:hypothetical protein